MPGGGAAGRIRLRSQPGRYGDVGAEGMDVEQDNVGRKGTLPNGMLVLKGGDLTAELTAAGGRFEVYDIAQWFGEAFFETKKVVYAPR